MDVDAVEQRAGDAIAIALDIELAAAALAFRVAEVATFARIGMRVTQSTTIAVECIGIAEAAGVRCHFAM